MRQKRLASLLLALTLCWNGSSATPASLLLPHLATSSSFKASPAQIELQRSTLLLTQGLFLVLHNLKHPKLSNVSVFDREDREALICNSLARYYQQMAAIGIDRLRLLNLIQRESLIPLQRVENEVKKALAIPEICDAIASLFQDCSDREIALNVIKNEALIPVLLMEDIGNKESALRGIYSSIAQLYERAPNREEAFEIIKNEALNPALENITNFNEWFPALENISKSIAILCQDSKDKAPALETLKSVIRAIHDYCVSRHRTFLGPNPFTKPIFAAIAKLYSKEGKEKLTSVWRDLEEEFIRDMWLPELTDTEIDKPKDFQSTANPNIALLFEEEPDLQKALRIFRDNTLLNVNGIDSRQVAKHMLAFHEGFLDILNGLLASRFSLSVLVADENEFVSYLDSPKGEMIDPINNSYVLFLGSLLTPQQLIKILQHEKLHAAKKYLLMLGFYLTHQGQEIAEYSLNEKEKELLDQTTEQFISFPPTLHFRRTLISALGNIQSKSSLEKLKSLQTPGAPMHEKRLISVVIGYMGIPEAADAILENFKNYPMESFYALYIYLRSLKTSKMSQEDKGEIQSKIQNLKLSEPLGSWERVTQWIQSVASFQAEPAIVAPILRYLIVGLRLQPYRRQGFGGALNVETLPNDFNFSLRILLSDIRGSSLYPEIRRLIKLLPLSENQINNLRRRAMDLAEAVYGDPDIRGGFVGGLRDRIHNRPSPQHLNVAKAYRQYLRGDQSDRKSATAALAKLGYSIDAQESGSYTDLRRDRTELARVVEALDRLIDSLEEVYGQTSLEQIWNIYWEFRLKKGHPLSSQMSALSDEVKEVDLDELDWSGLASLLNLVSRIQKTIESEMEKGNLDRILLTRLDVSLDTLVYQLTSRLLSKGDEVSEEHLIRVIPILIQLSRAQLRAQERAEVDLIQNELQNLDLTSLDDNKRLRYFSIVQRLQRLVRTVSNATVQSYQELAKEYGKRVRIQNNQILEDFSADLLREESIYQLSLLLEKMEDQLARELEFPWMVTRPGRAEGQLIYVANSARLQYTINRLKKPTILVVESIPDDVVLNEHVRCLIGREEQGVLSHVAIRADQTGAVLVRPLGEKFEELARLGQKRSKSWVRLEADSTGVSLIEKREPKKVRTIASKAIQPLRADLFQDPLFIRSSDYTRETVGKKGFHLRELSEMPEIASVAFVPENMAIPFGFFEKILDQSPQGTEIRRIRRRLKLLRKEKTIATNLSRLRELIGQLGLPENLVEQVRRELGEGPYMVRSSTNAEDLEGYPGAGLYESYPQMQADKLPEAILKVYQSLYSERGFLDRRRVAMDEVKIYPAVVIQKMVQSEYSFVIHTQDPTNGHEDVLLELVPGLGESLVSGAAKYQGSPHRFRYKPKTGFIERVAYANKSFRIDTLENGGTVDTRIDYTSDPLTQEILPVQLEECLKKLGEVALQIQDHFNGPQDIEGAIEMVEGNPQIKLVQSRAQVQLDNSRNGPPSVVRFGLVGERGFPDDLFEEIAL